MTALGELRLSIKLCKRCPLHQERECAVPGDGPEDARIVLIGEAPGSTEDKTGEPFKGRSGKLLDSWLEKAGLTRDEVFVTNVIRCRPPENKFPTAREGGPIEKCMPYLKEQLAAINPDAIVVFGKNALQHVVLDGSPERIGKVDDWVGRIVRRKDLYGETRIGVAYHPAYILRSHNPIEADKCVRTIKAIANFCLARRRGEPAPPMDLYDVRPATPPSVQQKFKLFGQEPK